MCPYLTQGEVLQAYLPNSCINVSCYSYCRFLLNYFAFWEEMETLFFFFKGCINKMMCSGLGKIMLTVPLAVAVLFCLNILIG